MKKKTGRIRYQSVITLTLIAAVIATFFGIYLMRQYEKSLLNIYATQQDAYVQLVLDQINLQPKQTDEAIIENILGTLNTSDSSYWTLSKEQTLLYVKNVTETNQYKGVTTDSFYITDTATRFLDSLTLNRVVHRIIYMNDTRYVASGVIFEYNNASYRICLLTDDTVILDNNDFLATKIAMYIFWIVLLIILVVVSMTAVIFLQKREVRLQDQQAQIEHLNRKVERLEYRSKMMNLYGARWNVYQDVLMTRFVEKLDIKKIRPVTFARIHFSNETERAAFLNESQYYLDEHVLRFYADKTDIDLVFVKYHKKECLMVLSKLYGYDESKLIAIREHTKEDPLLELTYADYLEQVKEHRNEHNSIS